MSYDWFRRAVHDLRNPAATLRTAGYLLRHVEAGSDEHRELLELVDRQSARLLAMLDELGDGLAAQRGMRVTSPDAVDLRGLVRPDPEAAPLQADHALPVKGDPVRLAQLMRTLQSLRLAPAATGVEALPLHGRREGDAVRLSRRLQALPDLAADPARLLEAPLPQNVTDSLGLQLPIAAAICAAHGGQLAIEREDERMLRVEVSLPAQPDADAAE